MCLSASSSETIEFRHFQSVVLEGAVDGCNGARFKRYGGVVADYEETSNGSENLYRHCHPIMTSSIFFAPSREIYAILPWAQVV